MAIGGETGRIVRLPAVDYSGRHGWTERLRLRPDARPLNDIQESFLEACRYAISHAFDGHGPGVAGLISCGGGKTLALQLAPLVFGVPRDRALLLTEANLVDQTNRAVEEWSLEYPCVKPEILTYGKLSHPTGQAVLDEMRPRLIMADEAHRLGPESARYRRLKRYLGQHGECRFVAVTGTLMQGSIEDMSPVLELVLRDWSPVPRGRTSVLCSWASCIDPAGEPDAADKAVVRPVTYWAKRKGLDLPTDFRTRARLSAQHRIATAPGVVVSRGPIDVPVSLRIRLDRPPISPAAAAAIRDWTLPDGTEIVDAFEMQRAAGTLRAGFYYRFIETEFLDDYLDARRAWGRITRRLTRYGGFETPYFVELAAREGKLGPRIQATYRAWVRYRIKYPQPETEAVWVGEAELRAFVDPYWAHPDGVIVWTHNKALQAKLAEWYGESSVYPAGGPFPSGVRRAVVSLAFRKGWEGQAFNRVLVLQPPSKASAIEQLISRHHRTGQTRDVECTICYTEAEHWAMRGKAQALQDTTGNHQRYLLADFVE